MLGCRVDGFEHFSNSASIPVGVLEIIWEVAEIVHLDGPPDLVHVNGIRDSARVLIFARQGL